MTSLPIAAHALLSDRHTATPINRTARPNSLANFTGRSSPGSR